LGEAGPDTTFCVLRGNLQLLPIATGGPWYFPRYDWTFCAPFLPLAAGSDMARITPVS